MAAAPIYPADPVDRVMQIMGRAFDPQYGEAWNRRQVSDALLIGNCHLALISADGTVSGLDHGSEPAVGFALSRTAYDEEELLLFAIDPSFRRRGLGVRLLGYSIDQARARGARRLYLEMRRGNPARELYLAYGFGQVGVRPDYYRQGDGTRIDALSYQLAIN